MFRKLSRYVTGLALLTALAAAAALAAQQPDRTEVAPPPEPRVPDDGPQLPPSQTYRAKEILGSKVSLEGSSEVGTVDDIVFDDYGTVNYLIVIASDDRLVTVPWEAAKFSVERRTAVVHIAPERFEAVPRYTREEYPVFSQPTYRTEIFRFFGLKPRHERREREDDDD